MSTPFLSLSGLVFLTLIAAPGTCQSRFEYSPARPQAGDVIRFTYQVPAFVKTDRVKASAVYYHEKGNGDFIENTEDLIIEKINGLYTGVINSTSHHNLIALRFEYNEQVDKTDHNNFFIILSRERFAAEGAYHRIATSYIYGQDYGGVLPDHENALVNFEREISLYPGNKPRYLSTYLQILKLSKKNIVETLQTEIDSILEKGLQTEDDYEALEKLYNAAGLTDQVASNALAWSRKFPDGKWKATKAAKDFLNESDAEKAEAMLRLILQNIQNYPSWQHLESNIHSYQFEAGMKYYRRKNWKGLDEYIHRLDDPTIKPNLYGFPIFNMTSIEMPFNLEIFKSENTDPSKEDAVAFLRSAKIFSSTEWWTPTLKKLKHQTTTEWIEARRKRLWLYHHAYAQALYLLGKYVESMDCLQQAIKVHDDPASYSGLYSLLAEKVLTPQDFQSRLEGFVRNGFAANETLEVLRRVYLAEKKSGNGFDHYIEGLKNEHSLKMVQALKQLMIDENAPGFILTDTLGNEISLAQLKGKVIVLDFWATWCAPCIASFPAMEKIVDRYEGNPQVLFLFVNTMENSKNKKDQLRKFMKKHPFNLNFLLDEDNKASKAYNIQSIPAKIVIDKNGIIRFKSFDFDRNDLTMINELSAMIDLAVKN